MPKERKDTKTLNVKLSAPVYEQMEEFCNESGMTKTMATEKILQHYFSEYFQRPEGERKLFK